MIIVHLKEGMGNQMFQYAFGKALARRFKTKLVLDTRFFERCSVPREYCLNKFRITEALFDEVSEDLLPDEIGLLEEEGWFRYDSGLVEAAAKNTYLTGYWQAWKYFEGIEPLIRKKFRILKEHISPQNSSLGESIKQVNSVSIHVRRTDFLLYQHKHIGVLPVDYYNQAISLVENQISQPIFYIFSDEPDWAEEHINTRSESHVVRGNTDIEDLYLMSQCKHNIIANSSFSWWGAWLNTFPEKMVIVPQKWFVGINLDIKDIDLIPPGWIAIDF